MAEPKIYFECNPVKNYVCKKTNCWLNGGPCKHTTNVEFAKDPNAPVKLVLPVERTEAVEFGWLPAEEENKDDRQ